MDVKELALAIATDAHRGQYDKGGESYIHHPVAVAAAFADDCRHAAALLHDVVEDTALTLDHLRDMGIPGEVVLAVDALTKRDGEPYPAYLARVKANPVARDVKLADLTHNSRLSRIQAPTEKDYKRIEKYRGAIAFLEQP